MFTSTTQIQFCNFVLSFVVMAHSKVSLIAYQCGLLLSCSLKSSRSCKFRDLRWPVNKHGVVNAMHSLNSVDIDWKSEIFLLGFVCHYISKGLLIAYTGPIFFFFWHKNPVLVPAVIPSPKTQNQAINPDLYKKYQLRKKKRHTGFSRKSGFEEESTQPPRLHCIQYRRCLCCKHPRRLMGPI